MLISRLPQLEGSDVPSHTQNDDLLVKVPSLEQILCRGRFRHPGRYAGYRAFLLAQPDGRPRRHHALWTAFCT